VTTALERLSARYEVDRRELRRWLIEAMVLGATADGELDQRESDGIIAQIATLEVMEGIGPDELRDDLDRAVTSLINDGFRPRVHALAGALPGYPHRVLAFRAATAVAFANGRLDDGEFDVLRIMQEAFGISEADVTRAFEDAQTDVNAAIEGDAEPVEAYFDCLLMAAAASGRVAEEEMATIAAFVISRPEFDGIPEDHIRAYMDARFTSYANGGAPARLEELADELTTPEHRENAWGLAASVVVADGTMSPGEERFLRDLQLALALDDARAQLVLRELGHE
jgi:tellurite resistance protein